MAQVLKPGGSLIVSTWQFLDNARLRRDVPEFRPAVSLAQGLTDVIQEMDRQARIPNCQTIPWESLLIAAQRRVGAPTAE